MTTRSLLRHALALTALACLSAAHAYAQTFYPNDAIINYAVYGNAIVGYANQNDANAHTNGTSPTVSVVAGGFISAGLDSYNNSTVNVSSETVGDFLSAHNNSTINMSGNNHFLGVNATDTSIVNVFDSYDIGALNANSSGTINVFGGKIDDGLTAHNSSTLNVTGGNIGAIFADNSSTVNVSGGKFGQANGVNFFDYTDGIFTLIGSNLTATNARSVAYLSTDYDLSGTLQDGTNLNGYILRVADGSSFKLQPVPETSTLVALPVLLATLGAGLVCKHRVQK